MANKRRTRKKNGKRVLTGEIVSMQVGGSIGAGGGIGGGGYAPNTVNAIIWDEFSRRLLDPDFAIRVAQMESTLDPRSVNPDDNGYGRSLGLFQLNEQGLLPDFYRQGYTDPFNPRQQASYVADFISQNGVQGWHDNWYNTAGALLRGGELPQDYSGIGGVPGLAGGGGTSISDYGPVRAGLEGRGLDIQAGYYDQLYQLGQLDAQIGRERIAADREIALGNLAEATRHNQTVEILESFKLQLEARVAETERELGFAGISLGARGQDVTQRGQDVDAELTRLGLEERQFEALLDYALGEGDLALQRDMEERLRVNQLMQVQLTQRGQDVTVRGQDIDAQSVFNQQQIALYEIDRQDALGTGNLQLAQDIELRQRALMQQNALLAAQGQALQAAQSQAGAYGDLASIEQQRQSEMARLAANPRDFPQLMMALGGGQNFLSAALGGQPILGQSTANIGGTPTLGASWDALVGQLNQRPAFDAAMGAAGRLGQFDPNIDSLLQMGILPGLQQIPQGPERPYLAPPAFERPGDVPLLQPPPLSPMPGQPQPPNLTPQLPQPVPGLGPSAGLSPQEQAIFDQWMAAAPNTPYDVAVNIAKNPDAARRYMEGAAGKTTTRQTSPAMQTAIKQVQQPKHTVTGGDLSQTEAQDLAERMARGEPIRFVPGNAGGGDVMLTEPALLMGLRSGQPLATMGEPTRQFPGGIPERIREGKNRVEVTPITKMQDGGNVMGGFTRVEDILKMRQSGASDSTIRQMPGVQPAGGGRATAPPSSYFPPGYRPPSGPGPGAGDYLPPRAPASPYMPTFGPTPGGGFSPVPRYSAPRAPASPYMPTFAPQPGGGFGSVPRYNTPTDRLQGINPRDPRLAPVTDWLPGLRPTNPYAGFQGFDFGGQSPGVPIFRQPFPSFNPSLGVRQGTAGVPMTSGSGINPGQAIFNIMRSLGPRSYNNLLPSSRGFLGGISSAFGVPDEDLFSSIERQFPRGIDPSVIFSGNF